MLNVASLAVIAALAASADASTSPPASPAGAAAAAAAKPAPPADPLDKVVCRSEPTTGTRLGAHKVCHTMRDWNEMQRQTSEDLDNGRQRGLTTGHDRGG